MSNICQVTGKKPSFGNAVSHSNRRTRRRWSPNIQHKRYWVPSERRWITLTVSTRGMKVIDVRGIDSVVAELRRKGVRLR
jgi:large subunit ribosomal protein L28